ncbi:phage protease [Paractinoplanes toevensis]|nr:phage protease [Actinoplanes toevensis]
MKCPAVGKPILKIGHLDKRFAPDLSHDGEPGIGWVDNLRAEEDGHLLLGDYVGMPAWIDQVMASAWPKRSIEGKYNYRCALSHTHHFALDAVSLLGTTQPAIPTLRSLNDVAELYGVDIAASEDHSGDSVYAVVAAAEVHTGAMIALVPTAEDAVRLSVDDGLPVEEIHLTLAYLGEAADLGAQGRQDVIDSVSRAANGLPHLAADVFAAAVFNPGDAQPDRDPCHVYLISGDLVDAVHDLTDEALFDVLFPGPSPIPAQHRPWFAHVTAEYTNDLARLAELTTRMGPITFDRIRLAFAGEVVDIPLIPPDEQAAWEAQYGPVAASAADVHTRIATIRASRAQVEVSAAHPFDESKHKRDGDGQFAHTAGAGKGDKPVPSAQKSRDSLNMAGRIALGDGETLVSSGKVKGGEFSTADTLMAVTSSGDGPGMRFGVVGSDDARDWDGSGDSTVRLDEDGIGHLWDAVSGFDDQIKKRSEERRTQLAEHEANVAALHDKANDWYAGLPADEQRSPANLAKFRQMRAAAYRAEEDDAPGEEFEGDIVSVDAADGGQIQAQLYGRFDGDKQHWEVQAVVRPAGAEGWDFGTAVGNDHHTTWEPKQLREMARTLDRLTVADDTVSASAPADGQTLHLGWKASDVGGALADAIRRQVDLKYAGIPNLPAAEPEHEINPDPKEDLVSTELSGIRSRLGLDDTADEQAILSALDELKAKADTPITPEPTPEMVAASAAAVEKAELAEAEKDELRKEVTVLASQVQTMSAKLAATEAEKAATVKASVIGEAARLGKFTPAEREQWETDYDEAPGAITRVLASIAPGTAVPVMASGTAGTPEPVDGTDDDWDAIVARLDGPSAKAV